MSAVLTGYGRVQLAGTGQVDAYLRAVDESLPAGVLDDMLAMFGRLLASQQGPAAGLDDTGLDDTGLDDTGLDNTGLDDTVAAPILGDQRLGTVARTIILLWYSGTWTALPDAWHDAYGAAPSDVNRDVTRVVSAQSYQAGLQWAAAGAHPAGARAQGFGAWALPPEGGSA
jgi:hypothetical protein